MKPTKHISTPSHALASAPEVPYRKQLLNLSLSPKVREKHGAKLVHHKAEPMVIKSPPTGENIMRYALPIPSIQTKRLIAGDEKIKEIIKHLIVVVSGLEETYGFSFDNIKSKKADSVQEDLYNSVGNLKSFMTYCSELATQLEQSCKEERSILRALFKWFQQQVNHMEEISKDQNFADDFTLDERPALAYSQLGKLIGKLEQLRNYVKHAPKYLQKSMEYENLLAKKKSYEILQQQIQEFVKCHSDESSKTTSDIEKESAHSASNQLKVMINMFKMQSKKLERVLQDQNSLEDKCKDMETNLEALALEKFVLQNELQTLKTEKKKMHKDSQVKKAEKKKDKSKSQSSIWKIAPEDFLQLQTEANDLKVENINLKEQLKNALLELEKNKKDLERVALQRMGYLLSESKSKVSVVPSEVPIKKSSEEIRTSPAISDLSLLSKSQEVSPVCENSDIDADDKKLLQTSSSQTDIVVLFKKESPDLLPAATSSQESAKITSLTSLPAVAEGSSQGDESESFPRMTEIQSFLTEEQIEAHIKESLESPVIQTEVSETKIETTKSTAPKIEGPKETEKKRGQLPKVEILPAPEKSDEGLILEHPDKELEEEVLQTQKEVTLKVITSKYQKLVSRTRLTVKREKKLIDTEVDPYESIIAKLQESFSKLEIRMKQQDISKGKVTYQDEKADEKELQLNTQEELKKQKSREEKISTLPVKIQKESVSSEHLLPEKESRKTKSKSTLEGLFKDDLYKKVDKEQSVQKMDEKYLPVKLVSKEDYPPTKKQKMEPVGKLDKVMDGAFRIEYQKSDLVDQIQEAKQKQAAEHVHTPESPVLLSPTISDIISLFELDKVVENDVEYLRGDFGKNLLKCEVKNLPKMIPGIGMAEFPDVPRNEMKKEFKTILRNPSLTTTELFTDNTEGGMINGGASSSTMNLSGKRMSFLKKRTRSMQQSIRTKLPTRVVNLTLFYNQVEDEEKFSPYVTASLKPFYTTLRPISAICKKNKHLVVKKHTTAIPKIRRLNEKPFKFPNLHIVTTTTKKNLRKGMTKSAKLNEHIFELQKNQLIMTSTSEKNLYKVLNVAR
ncbi:coiled-coil domain-containing protein 7 isoform X2 [Dipodomys merriami]|uniref:coiled-coil domain-containing protein 7 isoform X2 n=1 Tax=Dipodomys merriami TaxID=94247 RepID=UPI00385585B1